ncbi:MAG: carboxypeptidase regulatory-like domain-containing protein, partial [Acidobacteriota bacterium]|nr:carboxypeptidase regulatory-like domain-containing protein [Acidobacteriota bacterium]
ATGEYVLSNLQSGGNYTVTPTKNTDVAGITAFDATLVLRCVAAGTNCALTPEQQKSANVDNDQNITAFDATLILRFVAANGPNANTGRVGTWEFNPENRMHSNLSENKTDQDYTAFLIGDVDGDWMPPASPTTLAQGERSEAKTALLKKEDVSVVSTAKATVVEQHQDLSENTEKTEEVSEKGAEIRLSLPENASAAAGNVVKIPVVLGNDSGKQISAFNFAVRFDPAVLQPLDSTVETENSLTQNGFTIAFDSNQKGRIGIAATSLRNTVTTSGVLLYLQMRVVGESIATTDLAFERSARNKTVFADVIGNKLSTKAENGLFSTSAQPNASISVSGRVLTSDGRGIRNVQVSLIDQSGQAKTVLTTAFGNYRFADVAAGENYTISVSAKRYSFSKQSRTVSLTGETEGINFVADF